MITRWNSKFKFRVLSSENFNQPTLFLCFKWIVAQFLFSLRIGDANVIQTPQCAIFHLKDSTVTKKLHIKDGEIKLSWVFSVSNQKLTSGVHIVSVKSAYRFSSTAHQLVSHHEKGKKKIISCLCSGVCLQSHLRWALQWAWPNKIFGSVILLKWYFVRQILALCTITPAPSCLMAGGTAVDTNCSPRQNSWNQNYYIWTH